MADVRLPDIKASVKVDSKDVDAGLSRVQASTGAAGKGFAGLQSSAKNAIDSMSSSLTSKLGPASGAAESALGKLSSTGSLMGPAIAGGAALAGVAVAKFALDGAQQFVALASEVRNFQRASGASAEESSRFVAALDDLGISSELGAGALFKLGKKAADGGADLAKLGIEVAHAKDGTVDLTETLLNAADAYAAQPDPAKRAELAFAAFGKQGQALVPILEQGRKGLEAFFKGADSGRQIFSPEDLAKARKYELAIDDLQDTFRGLKLEAGEAILPFLNALATGTTKVVAFAGAVKDKVGGALEAVVRTGFGVATLGASEAALFAFRKLSGGSDKAKVSQKELAEQVKATAVAQQEETRASAEQAAALDRVTNATLSALSSQLGYEQSVNTLKDNINDLDDRTSEYNEAVATNGANSKEAEAANRALRDAHLGIETSAIAAANAAVRLADDIATTGGKALTAQEKSVIFRASLIELADQAAGPTRNAILGLADQIAGLPNRTVYVDADTTAANEKIAALQRNLNAIEAASVSGDSGTTSGNQRAMGGPVTADRPYIVGEHRPELFVPEVNGRIIPRVPSTFSPGSDTGATAGSATPPVVHTTIVIDRKVLAEATARGMYEERRSR